MEISTVLSKSKHPLLDFFKQENPFEISSKPTKRIKKPNPIRSKSLAKSLSKQDPKSIRPTISSPKKSNPTVQKSPPNIKDNHLHRLRQTGHLEEAVTVLESIAQHGAKVRTKTYISLLQSCIDSDSIDIGRKIHARIDSVRNSNPFVETKLVSMYAKCGSLDEARRVFAEMRERNLFTWSAMIGACAREQRWEEIVKLFAWMMAEGVIPDGFLVPKIMQACANLGDVEMGESVHSIVIRSGLDSLVHVSNSILAMYAKCGRLHSAKQVFEKMGQKDLVTWNSMISGCCQGRENEEAMKLFDRMQAEGIKPGLITWNILIASYNQSGGCDRAMELMKKMESSGIMPDVFTWTSMISGSAQNNRTHQALDLFREMWLAGIEPNGVTIVSVVSSCTSLKAFKKGTEIHSITVKSGSANDVLVGNSLIDLYSKCGKVEDAQRVFDKILERDIFTWNSMIGGYLQAGYCGKAHDLFEKMQISGIRRNVVTWNVMISGYMQNGDEDQAMELFKRMETDGIKKSTASWNLLIAGSLQNGHSNKALMIFRQMQSICMRCNSVTILSVLPACANLVSATKVKEIHACVLRSGLDCEVSILNLLIDTYAKSGDIVSAQSVFDSLSSKDLISWNSLLLGFVLHGRSEIAIDLFNQMKRIGVKPNHTTFTSMIAAYGHAGLVNEGKELFSSMTQDYQISPVLEHYAGIVDLLGRSGRLREAAGFIEKMPVEPDWTVWSALLTACRVHGNISLAIHAAEHLIKLEPGNSVIHRLLLQMNALGGRTSDASKVRKPKKQDGIVNSFGCSWIDVKNMVHTIFSGDQSMPKADVIYAQLDNIAEEAKKGETGFHDMHLCIEEEEKIAGIHSEKLAIALALVGTPAFQSIRIIKNLRMCTGCHNAAKLISRVHGREIFLKDPKCLHHFKNGQCSCKDYW